MSEKESHDQSGGGGGQAQEAGDVQQCGGDTVLLERAPR